MRRTVLSVCIRVLGLGLGFLPFLSVGGEPSAAERSAIQAFNENRWLEGMLLAQKTDITMPELQCFVGRAYYLGRGVEKDKSEGIGWFHKAGRNGDMQAQYYLGLLYKDGDGVPSNREEAVEWFRKSANQGLLAAMHEYAMLTDDIEVLERAAKNGYAKSQSALGLFYLGKKKAPKRTSEGLDWLRAAARQGDSGSAYMLGLLLTGSGGLEVQYVDFAEGEKWLWKSVENGDHSQQGTAALILASAYQQGKHVAQNYPLAVKWGEKAGDLGMSLGYTICFAAYLNGQSGVPKDLNKAARIVDKMERSRDPKTRNLARSFRKALNLARW